MGFTAGFRAGLRSPCAILCSFLFRSRSPARSFTCRLAAGRLLVGLRGFLARTSGLLTRGLVPWSIPSLTTVGGLVLPSSTFAARLGGLVALGGRLRLRLGRRP